MSGIVLDTLTPFLIAARAKMEHPRSLLKAWGLIMEGSAQENIEQGGRPEKFQALALATLEARARGRSGKRAITNRRGEYTARAKKTMKSAKPLIWSGALLRSLTSSVDGDSVLWGTNKVQGPLMNFGGQAGRGHAVFVPARPFIVEPSREDIDEMTTAAHRFIGVSE